MSEIEQLIHRVDATEKSVYHVKDTIAKHDLLKMIKPIRAKISELSKAEINCRRTGKQTLTYTEIRDTVCELIENLEKHLVFAKLMI